ncbi:MATE family efflux transporter [Adhaeribacter soli]|uniref:Multidrug-efflux transporter n=1 Tax=Adhaeribacter soli TaxID=2607655 RepID=A0A5N1J538_9BACT|nr:MATE family efflux transporter [Adhaeribacter soli]KAA9346031.1 MATE family efflux transporter [Adhaeribacter soli]
MFFSEYKSHFKANLSLAYPVVLSQLGHILVSLADNIMVAQLGTIELDAAALANSVFVVIMVCGLGLSFSITPLVAASVEKKNHSRISLLLVNGTVLCTWFGVLLAVVGLNSSSFLHYLNQPAEVVNKAIPFFNILLVSLIPLMIFQGVKQFAEGLSITKLPMLITIGANILNVILNYLLIYGKLGLPELGINGAAYATLVSRCLMATAIWILIFRLPELKKYSIHFRKKYLKIGHLQRLTKIGFPISVQMIFESGAFSFSTIMAGWISIQAQAAHQIALSIASVTYMMASGLAAAGTIRVGMQAGKGDFKELRKAGYSNLILGGAFMTFCGLLFILLHKEIPYWYAAENPDMEVMQLAAGLLIIAAFFQISDGVQVVGLGVLRGLQDVRIPSAISLVAYWVVALPLGYLLGFTFELGIYGVWTGLLVGLTIAALLLFLRFRKLTGAH